MAYKYLNSDSDDELDKHVFLVYSYQIAFGNQTKLPRFAFDVDMRPAIVGSYSYDIVKGKFVVTETNNATTEINLTDIILSTSATNSPFNNPEDIYRKHVGDIKPYSWWKSQKNSTNDVPTVDITEASKKTTIESLK